MGFLDRILGTKPAPTEQPRAASTASTDDQAISRYRYLLRTAPPEAVEQAHAEAFAQLTPAQRTEVLRELSNQLPPSERASAPQEADPQQLARMATRAELRQPGMLERLFGARGIGGGGGGGGLGLGGMMAGTLLSSIAGTFIGSAIAHQFLDGFDHSPEAGHGVADLDQDQETHAQDAADSGDTSGDEYADNDFDANDDFGSDDFGGGDDFDV